jgi:hypothetical protein
MGLFTARAEARCYSRQSDCGAFAEERLEPWWSVIGVAGPSTTLLRSFAQDDEMKRANSVHPTLRDEAA